MSKRGTRSTSDNIKKKSKIAQEHPVDELQDIAHLLRIHSIEMTSTAGSGHPTSCASMAELMSVLFFDKSGMHYDAKNPKESFTSDRLVLSKGHTAPILYAAWAENGFIPKADLLNLRKIDSDLEGHPTPKLPFVDVATGSLGQGLGCAAGMAYSSKYLDKLNNTYWAILGDGESAEGSVWEAANFASFYDLENLVCIVDVNRLGQSQETSLGHNVKIYQQRFQSFGWSTHVVDGHNIEAIIGAFQKARDQASKPTCIIAQTFKGKYLPEIEDKDDWHGKPLSGDILKKTVEHLKGLIQNHDVKLEPTKPEIETWKEFNPKPFKLSALNYTKGQIFSTRKAYGEALKRLGASDTDDRIIALDGDTKNSTFALTYKNAYPEKFIECFIAEQNLVSIATGVSRRRKVTFASTFGAFFARAFDQIRMAGISHADIVLCGSHTGVSIGEDGPSQMALEDLSLFRALPNSIVFYPSDAVSTERAVELASNTHGIRYIRTSRPENEVLYGNDEVFEVGKSKTVFKLESDKILIVSAGVILHQSLKAAKALAGEGIHVRVLDIFTVKPIDKNGIIEAAKASGNLILTIEEHYQFGGIYDAVVGALGDQKDIRVFQQAVTEVPRSGKPDELLDLFGLSAAKIALKVKSLL